MIKAVRQIGAILPGDKVKMIGEKPATSRSGFQPLSTGLATHVAKHNYIGSCEEGDIQVDYIQMHTFELFDGVQVVLEIPSLNRSLGKLLY